MCFGIWSEEQSILRGKNIMKIHFTSKKKNGGSEREKWVTDEVVVLWHCSINVMQHSEVSIVTIRRQLVLILAICQSTDSF